MYCRGVEEAFKQIKAYFDRDVTGYTFIFDTEDMNIYAEVVQRLEADKNKKCTFVSKNCQKNGLPDISRCLDEVSENGEHVLIGSSQALMLRSAKDLEQHVDEVLGQSVSGHALICLVHCRQYIEKLEKRDVRVSGRVIIVEGQEETLLPKIVLVKEQKKNAKDSISCLLEYLERVRGVELKETREVYVNTIFGKKFFANAIYQVVEEEGIYEFLFRQYTDIAVSTKDTYGSEQQWKWLSSKLQGKQSFSEVVYEEFGITENLEFFLADVLEQVDANRKWLYWLALKVFGTRNTYLKLVLSNSMNVEDFEEHIYLDLGNEECGTGAFEKMFQERKKLLRSIPERLSLISKYCERVGKFEKKAVYYLTDHSKNEEVTFVKYMSLYDFTEDEIYDAAKHFSGMLELYLKHFSFDMSNTKVAEEDAIFRNILSEYFQSYKLQKMVNKIRPDFYAMVEKFAIERPYNKLRPRSKIMQQLDRTETGLFFFDALGVEYLAFIQAKCEEYGLVAQISIGHCELPSITEKNKEFIQFFDGKYKKIDELDKLKHHSQVYDYEKIKEPLHIFRELEIIDSELRHIESMLVQGSIKKAVIVSDHGASRLAVINEKENDSPIELEEKGKHSGRCCPVKTNPNILCAAYEDGFSVLANYERFKGGRKANVEVHGGASLEEVVIPVIVLTRKPENVEYCFTNPVIKLKQKEVAVLTLYCNIPMNNPEIHVEQKIYTGDLQADRKHAKFIMPELKRSREYIAEIYDGEKNLSISLKFRIQKSMAEENDLFL